LAPFRKIASDALTRGFRVPELQLTKVDDKGAGSYEIAIPARAELLSCALFICEPQFDVVHLDSDVGRIVQYGRCAVRDKTFGPVQQDGQDVWSLTLAELSSTHASCAEVGLRSASPKYPVVTDLALGCWALGEVRPVGATRMLKLSLSELPDFGQIPVRSCDVTGGGLDGSYCYLPASLGRCEGSDCVLAEVLNMPPTDGGARMTPAPQPEGATPLATCDAQNQGEVCVRGGTQAIGQCAAHACLPRGVESIELPLVVSSCAPDLVPDEKGVLPASSNFDTEGLNCFPSAIGGVGTCASGACRPRCVTSDDCLAHADSAGLSLEQAMMLRCQHLARESPLGVCLGMP
jgi:hypothetical protein